VNEGSAHRGASTQQQQGTQSSKYRRHPALPLQPHRSSSLEERPHGSHRAARHRPWPRALAPSKASRVSSRLPRLRLPTPTAKRQLRCWPQADLSPESRMRSQACTALDEPDSGPAAAQELRQCTGSRQGQRANENTKTWTRADIDSEHWRQEIEERKMTLTAAEQKDDTGQTEIW
jgi:hypothetical protein